jgi:hypothetical protein
MDDFSINYEENGILKIKEEGRVTLGKGAWITVIYAFREWDEAKGDYGPLKAMLRRYHKTGGTFRVQSRFNITGAAQANAVAAFLTQWFPPTTDDSKEA